MASTLRTQSNLDPGSLIGSNAAIPEVSIESNRIPPKILEILYEKERERRGQSRPITKDSPRHSSPSEVKGFPRSSIQMTNGIAYPGSTYRNPSNPGAIPITSTTSHNAALPLSARSSSAGPVANRGFMSARTHTDARDNLIPRPPLEQQSEDTFQAPRRNATERSSQMKLKKAFPTNAPKSAEEMVINEKKLGDWTSEKAAQNTAQKQIFSGMSLRSPSQVSSFNDGNNEGSKSHREISQSQSSTELNSKLDYSPTILSPEPNQFVKTNRNGESIPTKIEEGESVLDSKIKPRFLIDLERYISSEIYEISKTQRDITEGPNKARFLIYREAFTTLVDKFSTYKPILTKIQFEYDALISEYERQLHKIEPYGAELATLRSQCKREWDQWHERVEDELRKTRNDLAKKDAELTHCKQELEKITEISKSLETQLEFARDSIKDSLIKRQMLNDKVRMLEEVVVQLNAESDERRKIETKLRLHLESAQKDLQNALVENIKYKDQITSMVSSAQMHEVLTEFEKLKLQYESAQQSIATLNGDYQFLAEQHKSTLDTVNSLRDERMQLISEKDDLEDQLRDCSYQLQTFDRKMRETRSQSISGIRVGTVNLDWFEIQRVFGDPNIKEMSIDNIVKMLLKEVTKLRDECEELKVLLPRESVLKEGQSKYTRTLTALGTGEDVPPFLRFTGSVKNKLLSKKDTEMIIRDIWNSYLKKDRPERQGRKETLSEFFYSFLKKKYFNQTAIAEWGYNLMNALEKYHYDSDLRIFHQILSGQLLDEVYIDEQKSIEELKKNLISIASTDAEGTPESVLLKTDIIEAIKAAYPYKSAQNIEILEQALDYEHRDDSVPFLKLFDEDAEYNEGAFVETFRHQLWEERDKFIREIELYISGHSNVFSSQGRITPNELSQILKKLDPQKSEADISLICQKTMSSIGQTRESIKIDDFLKELKRISIRRTGAAREGLSRRPSMENLDTSPSSAPPIHPNALQFQLPSGSQSRKKLSHADASDGSGGGSSKDKRGDAQSSGGAAESKGSGSKGIHRLSDTGKSGSLSNRSSNRKLSHQTSSVSQSNVPPGPNIVVTNMS